MTFNEDDVNRKKDGKFDKKVGAKPDIELPPLPEASAPPKYAGRIPDEVRPNRVLEDWLNDVPNARGEDLAKHWAKTGEKHAHKMVGVHKRNIKALQDGFLEPTDLGEPNLKKAVYEERRKLAIQQELIDTDGHSNTDLVHHLNMKEFGLHYPRP